MPTGLFIIYISSIVIATIGGLARFKCIDAAMRNLVALLVLSSVSELYAFSLTVGQHYVQRYTLYHAYGIIQAILLTAYFLRAVRRSNSTKSMWAVNAFLWLTAGVLNVIFLQPLNVLNSNILMVESSCFISLSLYLIYHIMKKGDTTAIFAHPHFRIALICLVWWGGTFCFWAFVHTLYSAKWQYMVVALYAQVILDIIVYLGIAVTLLSYKPQKQLL